MNTFLKELARLSVELDKADGFHAEMFIHEIQTLYTNHIAELYTKAGMCIHEIQTLYTNHIAELNTKKDMKTSILFSLSASSFFEPKDINHIINTITTQVMDKKCEWAKSLSEPIRDLIYIQNKNLLSFYIEAHINRISPSSFFYMQRNGIDKETIKQSIIDTITDHILSRPWI